MCASESSKCYNFPLGHLTAVQLRLVLLKMNIYIVESIDVVIIYVRVGFNLLITHSVG